jgi:hypothetical protein
MQNKKKEKNPATFIAIGVCFMGSGVALSLALHARGAAGAGTGLIGMGVIFFLIGMAQKRKMESGESDTEDQGRPST